MKNPLAPGKKQSGLATKHSQLSVNTSSFVFLNIAPVFCYRYLRSVTAISVTDLGRSRNERRISAHHIIAGAFFMSAMICYGSCARDTFGCAGPLSSRSANPRTAATISCLAASGDSSPTKGASLMEHVCNLLIDCAAAHRAMAIFALKANSNLSVRLKRYQVYITKARSCEGAL
ncbi:hypothetical protein SAMN05216295_10572 [Pseudomonas luteola]|nr:hypothetical protein SAMN05216295_10572 [Pseudomonas zeshuii]